MHINHTAKCATRKSQWRCHHCMRQNADSRNRTTNISHGIIFRTRNVDYLILHQLAQINAQRHRDELLSILRAASHYLRCLLESLALD